MIHFELSVTRVKLESVTQLQTVDCSLCCYTKARLAHCQLCSSLSRTLPRTAQRCSSSPRSKTKARTAHSQQHSLWSWSWACWVPHCPLGTPAVLLATVRAPLRVAAASVLFSFSQSSFVPSAGFWFGWWAVTVKSRAQIGPAGPGLGRAV